MPIAFRCEHCSQLMSISRKLAGQQTVCPRCGQETRIPTEEEASATAGPPGKVEQRPPSPPVPQEKRPVETVASEVAATATASPAKSTATSAPSAQQQPEGVARRLGARGPEETDEELAFQLRRVGGDLEEMDLTPMVDVTFLLLIFFMVTASFSLQKSIETPPPDPDRQGAAQTVMPMDEPDDKSIMIEIDEQNRILVEDQIINDPRDLPTRLAEIRSRDQKTEVVVSVDARSRHESLVIAIDAAQEIGMQRIRWGVKEEGGGMKDEG